MREFLVKWRRREGVKSEREKREKRERVSYKMEREKREEGERKSFFKKIRTQVGKRPFHFWLTRLEQKLKSSSRKKNR